LAAVETALSTAATKPPTVYVERAGQVLTLNGVPWRFVGVNGPSTDYQVNGGCGAEIDYAALFASLPPNSVFRTSFGQDLAINNTNQRDWRGYDRIVAAAEASPNHIRLIVSLTSQGGICDGGHFKDASWYAGGYRQSFNDYGDAVAREPYWTYIHEVVPRYRVNPAIAIWEPAGEAEASVCDPGFSGTDCYSHKTCPPNATQILRTFFDTVGAEFKRMDPNHLVADGAIGGQQCGWAGSGGSTIEASPGVDVLTFHDYYGATAPPLPPEFAARVVEARQLQKPIVSEEVGMSARNAPGCLPLAARSSEFRLKLRAAIRAGVSGFVLWTYGSDSVPAYTGCDMYVFATDPAIAMLRSSAP
jgi:hypothetical protein